MERAEVITQQLVRIDQAIHYEYPSFVCGMIPFLKRIWQPVLPAASPGECPDLGTEKIEWKRKTDSPALNCGSKVPYLFEIGFLKPPGITAEGK